MPPLVSYTTLVASSIISILVCGTLLVPDFTLDADPQTGAFGFFTYGDFPYAFFAVGMVAGALTFGGYGYIVKFYSPIVLCTALLFEPFISQTMGCLLGLDRLPGPLTLVGTTVTLIGLYNVGVGGQRKKQECLLD
jgi:hypothetical protein